MPAVLLVLTSADKTHTGRPTGWYLPEAAHPYYVLGPHAKIDFASTAGPNPPVDKRSVENFTDPQSVQFLNDETVKSKLASTKKLSEVDAKDYDAIFFVGGHGPVIDLSGDPVNANLISEFWKEGKIVAAVCHGPAALVNAVDASGKSIFSNRRVTGFSNEEEELAGWTKDLPFLLEDKIKSLGGIYENVEPWAAKVVVDGQLYTGQNPSSAKPLAEVILKALLGQ